MHVCKLVNIYIYIYIYVCIVSRIDDFLSPIVEL